MSYDPLQNLVDALSFEQCNNYIDGTDPDNFHLNSINLILDAMDDGAFITELHFASLVEIIVLDNRAFIDAIQNRYLALKP